MTLINRSAMPVRPMEVGKIKIGGRGRARQTSGGGESYIPERFDHFKIVTLEREGENGKGAFMRDEAIHAAVGNEPRELLAWLMYPEVDQNLVTRFTQYKGRRMMVSCDGVEQRARDGTMAPCQRETPNSCPCKHSARLQVQLRAADQTGGYYVFRTSGANSTNFIQTALEEIYREFGTLFRAPIKLVMKETEDIYEVSGVEKTGKSWKVGVVLDMSIELARAYLVEQKREALAASRTLLLEAGAVQADLAEADVIEEGEYSDEFAPPQGVEASVGTHERLDALATELEAGEGSPETSVDPGPTEDAEADEEDCPTTQQPCEHGCEMECFLQDVTELELLTVSAKDQGMLNEQQEAMLREAISGNDDGKKERSLAWVKERIEKLGG